jgi:hypothetical protein
VTSAIAALVVASCAGVAPLVASCALEPPPDEAVPVGDPDAFAREVQPVLDARCADPTCHGRPERPLAIYSPGRHRQDPARTFLVEPLTPEELEVNARVLAAFALEVEDGVDSCLVLRKPLARAAGGCEHAGGEVFPGRDDREYRALRAWLAALRFEW